MLTPIENKIFTYLNVLYIPKKKDKKEKFNFQCIDIIKFSFFSCLNNCYKTIMKQNNYHINALKIVFFLGFYT